DFLSVFCLKINHGGTFTTLPKIRYKGSKVNWVDDIDSDIFSIVEVTSMMKELGYENPCMAYYYKKPNTDLDNGLTELAVDKDVCEMLMYVDKFKVIELYIDHYVNKKHVFIQEPLVLGTTSEPNEPDIGSGSESEVDERSRQSSRNGSRSENGSGSGSSSDSGSENGSDGSSGSDSEDSDYFMNEENLIDDVVKENEVFDLQEG
nr:transposase, MuDR [Tanacetum cinerariifolium]